MKNIFLNMVAPEKIAISDEIISTEHIDDEMVAGKTIYTLVSTGTEFSGIYMNALNVTFPRRFGYTAIFSLCNLGHSHGFIAKTDCVMIVVG